MEEILKKADELGRMLRDTEIYKKYEKVSGELESDPESKKLLEDYLSLFEDMHKKEMSGTVIEVSEKQELAEMQKRVSENPLIIEYIDAKNSYVNILMEIQKTVGGGDPQV